MSMIKKENIICTAKKGNPSDFNVIYLDRFLNCEEATDLQKLRSF